MGKKFTCPRRLESPNPEAFGGLDSDQWRKQHGLVGQATGCSYCGSMNPDDFMAAVIDGAEVGPTDKSYKFYVDNHRGKFYTQHLSEEQGWEFHRLWTEKQINWGYPGHPYVRLFIPGPSTQKTEADL